MAKKFEDKVKELEEIINVLESGDIELEASINKYTEAMKLVKECDEELKQIEIIASVNCIINGDNPNNKQGSNILKFNLKFLNFNFNTDLSLVRKRIVKIAEANWEITVAIAAPFTPKLNA